MDGTESDSSFGNDRADIGARVVDLACSAVQTQRLLDSAYLSELRQVFECYPHLRSHSNDSLVHHVLPPRMALGSLKVEIDMVFSSVRRKGAALGLSLAGTLVHAFFERRYEITKTQRSHLSFEIVSTPMRLEPGAASEDASGSGTEKSES